jgi:hypothetical protein
MLPSTSLPAAVSSQLQGRDYCSCDQCINGTLHGPPPPGQPTYQPYPPTTTTHGGAFTVSNQCSPLHCLQPFPQYYTHADPVAYVAPPAIDQATTYMPTSSGGAAADAVVPSGRFAVDRRYPADWRYPVDWRNEPAPIAAAGSQAGPSSNGVSQSHAQMEAAVTNRQAGQEVFAAAMPVIEDTQVVRVAGEERVYYIVTKFRVSHAFVFICSIAT